MKEKGKRGPGRPPTPIQRNFAIGDFQVTITGPKDGLKWESRHDYLQFAVDDGELREKDSPATISSTSPTALPLEQIIAGTVRAIRSETPSYIPSVGPGTTHILSDVGLSASQPIDEVAKHLKAVTESVGGF